MVGICFGRLKRTSKQSLLQSWLICGPKDTPSRKKGTQTQTSVSAISCFLVSCACVAARLTKCNVPTEQCSILKRHICWCITTCGEQRWEKHESISHRALWLYPPLPCIFYILCTHPTDKHTVYWFLNQLLMSRPVFRHILALFFVYLVLFSLCLLLPFSGKPESYAEYFSLNATTAELLLLKPVDRELHRRFDLVIKVRNTGTDLIFSSYKKNQHPTSLMCSAFLLKVYPTLRNTFMCCFLLTVN